MRLVLLFALLLAPATAFAQSTSTDLFVMPGSDFVRPGLGTRANLNDEPTFAYTYENGGSHGFWHTQYGSHTVALGLMKNFSLPKSMTGYPKVKNRGYHGDSIGLSVHVAPHQSIWVQETYNKVASVPWYTSTGVGYTVSW